MWLAIAILMYRRVYQKLYVPKQEVVVEEKLYNRFDIKKITVIDGNSFDLVLYDEKLNRILCSIPVKATAEAKAKVIGILNESSNPKVILKTKENDRWLGEIYFNNEGKEHAMSEWLSSNNLVYK